MYYKQILPFGNIHSVIYRYLNYFFILRSGFIALRRDKQNQQSKILNSKEIHKMDEFFSKRKCDRCGKMPDTKTNITVQLTGTDGNIFCVIAQVREALRRNGRSDLIKEFTDYITNSSSYEEALCRVME